MVYSFARVSATTSMQVGDYYPEGKRWWFRLHEKGGKRHEVPAHHNAEEYLDAYFLRLRHRRRGQVFPLPHHRPAVSFGRLNTAASTATICCG